MERETTDVNVENLSSGEIHEMEERRISMLNEAGIDEQNVLDRAAENLNTWGSYFNENIVRGKDDMNFVLRDQWTSVERSEFSRLFKPVMTFNKLYDPIKKIVGEQRRNKPDLIVRSLTGKASQDQINLRSDLVRTIAYQSQNDLVYQTAFKSALMMGFGAFQVCIDYESPRSFNKIIKYGLISDPTICSWDPTAIKPHKGDGNFCSRRYVLTRDEFFATYPYISNPNSFNDPYMLLDFQWNTRDTITICQEYAKEWFPLIIYKLSNGETATKEEWKEREKKFEDNKELIKDYISGEIISKEIPKIIGERQTQDYRIIEYLLLRNMVIDFNEWPSKHLPIPFVDGDSYYVEGRQYTKSFSHEARDAQKFINYVGSEIAAEIKNRRREQWIGTPDNIAGYEQEWRNPEIQVAMLRARPDPKTGQMPMKQMPWDLSPQLIQNFQRGTQDIREILGFSESESLQGRDISGKARRERKIEGSMSSYIYQDNLNQAIEQGGRVVLDLLPFIYPEERSVILSKKDGRSDSITLNKEGEHGKVENRIDKGNYDIEISTGPSFAVQQEIALEFLQQTIQAYPQAFPLIADLWAKNLDVQFMPQMAERFKTIVPPQVLAKEEGKELPPQPPSPQEQMMKMEMESKQMEMKNRQTEIQERAEELRIRQEKHEIEKAELMMKANKLKADMENNSHRQHVEMTKADMDFSAKIAKVISDSNHRKMTHT